MVDTSTATNGDNSDDSTGYNHFSDKQETALLLAGIVSLSLSLFGSGMILFLVTKTGKWKTELQHRLLAGLSIMDIIVTIAIGSMIFLAPKEVGRLNANGTFTTCEWVGFFFQFYLGSAFYNASLAFFYCLMVTYLWREHAIQKSMEPWVHIFAFGFPLAIGSAAMRQKLLNPDPMHSVCTTEPYPSECIINDDVECERGSTDSLILPIVTYFYLATVASGIYFTVRVYLSVRKQTMTSLKYSVNGQLDPSQQRRIRAVGYQAILYTAAFLNGFVVVLLDTVMEAVFFSDIESTAELKDKRGIFPTVFFIYLLFPMQGLLNFLVYIQPRLRQWRKANKDKTVLWAFRMVLTGKAPTTISKEPRVMTYSKTSFGAGGSVINSSDQLASPQEEECKIFENEQGNEEDIHQEIGILQAEKEDTIGTI